MSAHVSLSWQVVSPRMLRGGSSVDGPLFAAAHRKRSIPTWLFKHSRHEINDKNKNKNNNNKIIHSSDNKCRERFVRFQCDPRGCPEMLFREWTNWKCTSGELVKRRRFGRRTKKSLWYRIRERMRRTETSS